MKNLKTKESPFPTGLTFNEWINHINQQLENHDERNRSIQRADIKWPKGRKVSSHYAIEQ
jgi:hypothetical protein